MTSLWNYWINEPVFLDKGVSNIEKRKVAIYLFCTEGLIPFLLEKGFQFRYSKEQLTHIVLTLLFQIQRGKKIKVTKMDENPPEEVYQMYCDIFDFERWETFWSKWGNLQDFEEGKPGFFLRYALSEFVWSWIDMDISPAVYKFIQELEDYDSSEDVPKGREDPYLQDTSKRDYQDRHW